MNNEPVAWMDEDENVVFEKCKVYPIPLYTHPVKEQDEQFKKGFEAGKEEGWKAHKFHHPVKELTDEEIANTWDDVRKDATLKSSMKDIQDFARAILRKAQE
jgi:hypothetical protein